MAKESIWAKVGVTVAKLPFKVLSLPFHEEGRETIGRAVALPFNAVIYPVRSSSWKKSWNEIWDDCKNGLSHVATGEDNDSFCDRVAIGAIKLPIYPIKPSNWFNSWGEIWHDTKNGGRYIIGKDPKEYDSPTKTTKASKDLGVQITKQEKGKVVFKASRTLVGDVSHLSKEQLDQIKKELPNVTIFKEENEVVIEVDVEGIIKEIKDKNPKVDEKTIKEHAFKAIFEKIDGNFKDLAKITGGELKVHTDQKLLYGIAKKLYKECDNQKHSPEAMGSEKSSKSVEPVQASETIAALSKRWVEEVIKESESQSHKR